MSRCTDRADGTSDWVDEESCRRYVSNFFIIIIYLVIIKLNFIINNIFLVLLFIGAHVTADSCSDR